MEISTVFENQYSENIDSLNCKQNTIVWKSRTITVLKEDRYATLSKAINPMMSKPDRGEAGIRGGMDEEHGVYIEGHVTVSWGDSKSSSESTSDKDKNSENK